MDPAPARIVVTEGRLRGRIFEIAGPTILGRLAEAKIQVPDAKVSREHSKIYRQGTDYFIVDLNSRNGTHVNDAPVTKHRLKHGDEIRIGETRFRFERSRAPEPAPAKAAAPKAALRPKAREPAFREVIDLAEKESKAAPAGAIRADEIVVKDRALQFSKVKARKRPSLLFDDLGQRSVAFQLLMALIVLAACAAFLYLGLKLGGVVGGE